ncbi:MAG: hypothetical protein IPK98_01820 [Chloracidobacterium sp.]|nr:hypothetical protein [Chloracidobacterium sp.]
MPQFDEDLIRDHLLMLGITTNPFIIGAISLVIGMLLTLAIRSFATRFGFVAKPKIDRWHKRPTAMLGGVAIFAATTIVYFSFVPVTHDSLVVLGGSGSCFWSGSSMTSLPSGHIKSLSAN